jgi:hypothetical protein
MVSEVIKSLEIINEIKEISLLQETTLDRITFTIFFELQIFNN